MVHQAIRSIIVSDTSVKNTVGLDVYAHVAPQGQAFPYITFFLVDDIPDTHSLSSGNGSGHQRVQVDCWSTDYAQVKALALAVRSALCGASGTYNGTAIQAVIPEGSRDTYEAPSSAKELGVYGVSEDFIVWSDDS